MNRAVRNIAPAKGKKSKISVVIIAAGEADRMRSYGPIPLLEIDEEQTLIEHQISVINDAFPVQEIVLVCGYEAEKVMNNTPAEIIKVHNEGFNNEKRNEARSIGLGLRATTSDKVLLMYGDLVFNRDTLVNAKYEDSSIFIDESGMFSQDGEGCTFSPSNVAEHIFWDLPNKWAQIAFLSGKELQLFKQVVWNRDRDSWFGFEVLNDVIERGGKLHYQSPKNMKIIDIDSSKDIPNIRKVLCE